MSHKTLINGTAYNVIGGKTLVGGTAYSISKGNTLVSGTAYDINFTPPTPPQPTSHLLGEYLFDGQTYVDTSGNGNDLTLTGTVPFISDGNGGYFIDNFVAYNDKAAHYLTAPANAFANAQMISFWFKAGNNGGQTGKAQLMASDSTASLSIQKTHNGGGSTSELDCLQILGNSSSNWYRFGFTDLTGVLNNHWHHAVYYKAGTNTWGAWLDGVKSNLTFTYNYLDTMMTGVFHVIGRSPNNQWDCYGSYLDNIRVYDAVLTDNEIIELYNLDKPAEAEQPIWGTSYSLNKIGGSSFDKRSNNCYSSTNFSSGSFWGGLFNPDIGKVINPTVTMDSDALFGTPPIALPDNKWVIYAQGYGKYYDILEYGTFNLVNQTMTYGGSLHISTSDTASASAGFGVDLSNNNILLRCRKSQLITGWDDVNNQPTYVELSGDPARLIYGMIYNNYIVDVPNHIIQTYNSSGVVTNITTSLSTNYTAGDTFNLPNYTYYDSTHFAVYDSNNGNTEVYDFATGTLANTISSTALIRGHTQNPNIKYSVQQTGMTVTINFFKSDLTTLGSLSKTYQTTKTNIVEYKDSIAVFNVNSNNYISVSFIEL